MIADRLESLAKYLQEKLSTLPRVRVVVEEKANWLAQVQQSLATVGEVLVLVSFGGFRRREKSGPLLTGSLTVDVSAHEMVSTNRELPDYVTAEAVVETIASVLHDACGTGFDRALMLESITPNNETEISVVSARFNVEQNIWHGKE